MSKILIVAAHPDDELLGCGGTIIEHIKKRDKVGIVIVSEGISSRGGLKKINEKKIKKLHSISKKISSSLKLTFIKFFKFPDNQLDEVNQLYIVKKIEEVIKKFKPDVVYTHHHSDLNIDHKIVNNATIVACRPFPKQTVKKILTFEIPSSSNWIDNSNDLFAPNYYVDITNSLKKKLSLLKLYKDEMRPWPHARSIKAIENLSLYRGSSIGIKAAEAFHLVRSVRKF